MIGTVAGAVAALAGIVAGIFALKSSANRQRREAEKDVEKAQAEKDVRRAEIEDAVFNRKDEKVNAIVQGLLVVVILAAIMGCRSCEKPVVKYVASDRRIVSMTNEYGVACKAVPDVVFVEMIERLEKLKKMETEKEVDKRLGK